VEHADTAQLAAVAGALGSVLVLLARGRVSLLAGLVVLALAEGGLVLALGTAGLDSLASPAGAAAGLVGLLVLCAAAAVLVKRPALVPLAVLVAAPFRPPIDFSGDNRFLVSIAHNGALGRLLPLYFVLIAAAMAIAWSALRGARVQPVPRMIGLPAAAFFAVAMASLLWAKDVEAGANVIVFFTLPFTVLLAVVARAPFPDSLARPLAIVALSLAGLFAVIGLFQAATHEIFFFAPNLEVSNANTDYFRVTSLFGDPSLYGRHVVLGIGVLLSLLATRKIALLPGFALLAVMWAGLFFSYSQSSMAALVVVTLAIAFASGDRQVRRVVGMVALAAALAAGGYVAVRLATGGQLNQITSDRTQRVEDTARVIKQDPVIGVGLGGQPRASKEAKGSDRPTASFVSHTTPLTVAAELGVIGLALYAWLLAGGARAIHLVRTRFDALGLALGASFLALFVHALFYSGFLEDPLTWLVLALAGAYLAYAEGRATAAERARERGLKRNPAPAAT
jgi:hypothetical protein